MRENGFYWVKRRGDWIIAECENEWFFATGTEHLYEEDELDAIGDKIEIPEKYSVVQ